ncbi:MAG: DUF1801 domain-containing protein [Chloroflexota bacterium]|nr:MAG: DUF1801 domain-containing protein [Chloroflexota bacterium]
MAAKTVDEYISQLNQPQAQIVAEVRKIIVDAVPEAEEAMKWAQPVYSLNGPFAYIKAFKNTVNFGFWRGVDIDDPDGLLQGSGEKMRHVKLVDLTDIDQQTFGRFAKKAAALNLEKGDPTRN